MNLLLLGNKTEKLHAVAETERVYQSFERSAIVTGARDLQSRFRDVELGECADDDIDPFVFLESAQIDKERFVSALSGIRRETRGIDAVINDPYRSAWNST